MPELSVVIMAPDSEQRAVLQVMVEGTSVARAVHTGARFPVAAADPTIRRMQAPTRKWSWSIFPAIRHPGFARHRTDAAGRSSAAIFAVGSHGPAAGHRARHALWRARIHRAAHHHHRPARGFRAPERTAKGAAGRNPRGKVFTVVNAKGGSGATTIAVNLALALQSAHGNAALVDIAPLGHAALHMNLKPSSPWRMRFAICTAWIAPCWKAS